MQQWNTWLCSAARFFETPTVASDTGMPLTISKYLPDTPPPTPPPPPILKLFALTIYRKQSSSVIYHWQIFPKLLRTPVALYPPYTNCRPTGTQCE